MVAASALSLPDLTLPRGNTSTVRSVLNAYIRETVRAFTTLSTAAMGAETRGVYLRTLAWVQPQLKSDPRRIVAALRQPTLAALLWSAINEPRVEGGAKESDGWIYELCLLLHFEVAVHGTSAAGEATFIRPAAGWPRLHSIAANIAVTLQDSVDEITIAPHALEVHVGGDTWDVALDAIEQQAEDFPGDIGRPYHRIVEGIALALADNNPLSQMEAHPDKSGNAIDLGGHPVDEWIGTLRNAFELIDRYLPVIGEEMRLVLRLIVPVGYHDQKHLSASYQEAVGTIYMTLHPSLMTMTEALVHEFQHNKINAAFHLDPMLENAFSPLYTSPVRPDPRPLHGIVLAVHAFQPIAKLYELMSAGDHPLSRSPAFQKRFRDIIRMNRAGSQTVLTNGQPTHVGAGLFHEMRALEKEQLTYEEAHWKSAPAVEPPPLPE